MSMQSGSWFCVAGSGAGFNQTACNLSKAGVPFASAAGTSFWTFACGAIGLSRQECVLTAEVGLQDPRRFMLHRRMIGSRKPSKKPL